MSSLILGTLLMSAVGVGLCWLVLRSKRNMIQGSCGGIDPTSGQNKGCPCYPDGKPEGADCKEPNP